KTIIWRCTCTTSSHGMARNDVSHTAGEAFQSPRPLQNRLATSYGAPQVLTGPWNWLDQLRFRFDFAIEVVNPDLTFALPAAPSSGRIPDMREELIGSRDALRQHAASVLRLGKVMSFTAGTMRIRMFPLHVGT